MIRLVTLPFRLDLISIAVLTLAITGRWPSGPDEPRPGPALDEEAAPPDAAPTPARPQARPVFLLRGHATIVDDRGRETPAERIELGVRGTSLRAFTDSTGWFTFRVATPGHYVIDSVDPTLTSWSYVADTFAPFDHTKDDRRFVERVRLRRNHRVPARGHRIRGRVVDAEGHPMEGVEVRASAPGDEDTARTNAAGEYTIEGLLPGTYRVSAAQPPENVFPRTYHPDTTQRHAARRIQLGSLPEVTGVDIRLAPPPVVTVRGVVLTPDGPGDHVIVQAYDHWQRRFRDITTDGEGRFSFRATARVRHSLLACYDGTHQRCGSFVELTGDRDHDLRIGLP